MSKYVEDWDKYPNFRKEEFKCKCGKCDGYGNGIATSLIETMQNLRTKYNKAINISSGYRCKDHNAKVGGSKNSKHMYGLACDFYFKDGSLSNQKYRVGIVNELKKTPYYHYSYCNVDGSHPNMGAAIHLDTLLVDIPPKDDNKDTNVISIDVDNNINIGDTNIIESDNKSNESSNNGIRRHIIKSIVDFFHKIISKIVGFFIED